MNTRRRRAFFMVCLATCVLASGTSPAAPAAGDVTLAAAVRTAASLHGALGRSWRPLIRRARAVLIAPDGRAGPSVLLLRAPGGWSEPAFFRPGALNSGSPAMLLIMSDRATDAVLRQAGLPLQGPEALTLAVLRAHAPTAELLLWSNDPRARPDPDGPHQDDAANSAFYGHPRNAADIVGYTPPELRSSRLRSALSG